MKTIIKLAAAGAIAASTLGVAHAQSQATGSTTATATVPNTCYIREIKAGTGGASVTPTGAGGNATTASVSFGNALVSTSTALSSSVTQSLTVDAYCNYAALVGLTSDNGGLTNSGTNSVAEGTFNRRIPYSATLTGWGGVTLPTLTTTGSLTTGTAGAVSTTGTAASGAVNTTGAVLTIVTVGSNTTPMLAGSYSDVLRVTFGATS